MKLKIDKELEGLLWPLTDEEYKTLEESIVNDGCRDALVVTGSVLLDGHNRYNICQEHGITFTTSSMAFISKDQAKAWVDKNQAGRRNLTPDQLRVIRGRRYNDIKDTHGGDRKSKAYIAPSISTAEKLAKQYAVSPDTIKRDAKFAEEVEADRQLFNAIKNRQSVKELWNERKVAQRKAAIEAIKKRIAAENKTITDKYDVVVIDPPWDYSEHGLSVEYRPDFNTGVAPYPTMTLTQIGDIKLPLKKNAVVFLWTTHAFLHDSFHLLEKWGLEYKATIVWDKEAMGLGQNIRKQCEFCLLATSGRPIIQGPSTRDIIREAKREHSRKPEAFYKMVEDITLGSRLDYFSRQQRKGWSSYGAETDKF